MRNQVGRLLFLKRQYREAISELRDVLAIDPEDLQAHYNLMLAYQGAGDSEMAKRHEALHPHDNERQAVHEHESALAVGTGYAVAAVDGGGPPASRSKGDRP